MENERKLNDIALSNTVWGSITSVEMLDSSIEEETKEFFIEHYITFMASMVVKGTVNLKDLREEAKAFNDLDAQAVDVGGGRIENLTGVDYEEALARRVGHRILRESLALVKTRNDRIWFKNRRMPKIFIEDDGQMPGMGRLEGHDFRALREEAEQVE